MHWMNSRKGSWACLVVIAFAIMVSLSILSCDMPTPTNSLPPTDTLVSTTIIASVLTGTPSPTCTPTATDALRPTSAPTSTNTLTPTSVPTATDTLTQAYPVPILVSPAFGATIMGENLTSFSWQCDGALQEGEWFDLRIWRSEKPPSFVSIRRDCECLLDTPPDGFGDYLWQVAVVRIDESGKSTLSESPIWAFVWRDVPPDAVVNVNVLLNLRSGPGTNYDIVRLLKQGEYLEVTGKNTDGSWLKVIAPGGEEGWVSASILEINLDMSDVPIVQAPPMPIPTYTPTPIATPAPTLLPPPILTEPENGTPFLGGPVVLRWRWDRPRAPNEVFSVRVRREGETKLCHHAQAKDLEWQGSLSYCTAGNHYWGVALVRDLAPWLPEDDENRWENLSEPSEERWFYYVPGK